jgi:hypothetical protein
MRLIVTQQMVSGQITETSNSAVPALRRYPLLLLLSVAGALIPFVAPLGLMNAIPPAIVGVWYGLLALAAGLCGIIWIIRAARLAVKGPAEVDIPLAGEAREKVLEALSFRGTQH